MPTQEMQISHKVLSIRIPGGGSSSTVSDPAPVPPLVNFSGVLTDMNGRPLTGFVGGVPSLSTKTTQRHLRSNSQRRHYEVREFIRGLARPVR